MSAESKEPRALAAQMRVLKRKEQRILECSFRITRAVAAREDAQRTLAEETRCVCVCVRVCVRICIHMRPGPGGERTEARREAGL